MEIQRRKKSVNWKLMIYEAPPEENSPSLLCLAISVLHSEAGRMNPNMQIRL